MRLFLITILLNIQYIYCQKYVLSKKINSLDKRDCVYGTGTCSGYMCCNEKYPRNCIIGSSCMCCRS